MILHYVTVSQHRISVVKKQPEMTEKSCIFLIVRCQISCEKHRFVRLREGKQVSWCFTPSQPVQLYQGEKENKGQLQSIKRAWVGKTQVKSCGPLLPLMGNWGCLVWVWLELLQEQYYSFLSVHTVFTCVQTIVWLPMLWIFNMHADDDDTIPHRSCRNTIQESALKVDWEKTCHTKKSNLH